LLAVAPAKNNTPNIEQSYHSVVFKIFDKNKKIIILFLFIKKIPDLKCICLYIKLLTVSGINPMKNQLLLNSEEKVLINNYNQFQASTILPCVHKKHLCGYVVA
jgi:hypothetical protein